MKGSEITSGDEGVNCSMELGSIQRGEEQLMQTKSVMRGKVLIMENHPLYTDALKRVLKQIFDHIDIVEVSGDDELLINVVDDHSFDLILLDLTPRNLADLSCLDELRRITATTPIVIISSTESPGFIREAFKRGATGYLPKTSSGEVMINAFKLIMSGETFMPASAIVFARPCGQDGDREIERGRSRDLTLRQQAVLGLILKGKANKEIANELDISESTVKIHVSAILKKLGASNRVQAALMASDRLL